LFKGNSWESHRRTHADPDASTNANDANNPHTAASTNASTSSTTANNANTAASFSNVDASSYRASTSGACASSTNDVSTDASATDASSIDIVGVRARIAFVLGFSVDIGIVHFDSSHADAVMQRLMFLFITKLSFRLEFIRHGMSCHSFILHLVGRHCS